MLAGQSLFDNGENRNESGYEQTDKLCRAISEHGLGA
jgi:hypothetical protein